MCICCGLWGARTDCIKSAIFELLAFSLLIYVIELCKQTLATYNYIVLGAAIVAVIAALALLFGALRLFKILVWIHIALIIPAAVIIAGLFSLGLKNNWDELSPTEKTYAILITGTVIFVVLDALLSSILFILKFKETEQNLQAEREQNCIRVQVRN